jgi:hypothetical protein
MQHWGEADMAESKRFLIYVIRLSPEVLRKKKFADENPLYREGQDCFYVGMTGNLPADRFQQHLAGYKACKFVTEFGLELMPAEYGCINPRTYEDALKLERRVAKRLRREGFAVWQR